MRQPSGRAVWVGLGVIALVFLHQTLTYWQLIGPAVIDDAFIPMRYARQLLAGHGLVYNPGEAVEGYTSFAWTVLLAGVMALGLDPLPTAQLLGVGCGLVTLWASWRITARLLPDEPRWLHLLPPLFLATNRTFCIWAVEAMETKLFGALFALALLAWLRWGARRVRRVPVTGLLLAALALTRPEGYLFALALASAALFEARRAGEQGELGYQAAAFGLVCGAHLAFRLGFYGDLLPNTFYAKVAGPALASGTTYLATAAAANHIHYYVPLVVVGMVALLWSGERRAATVCLVAVTFVYLGYLAFIGGDYFEFRFLEVILPLWALFAAAGIAVLSRWLASRPGRRGLLIGALGLGLLVANGASIYAP